MDEGLIKPQRVRTIVKIQQPSSPGEADVSAQGNFVEVADPRALRPKQFKADFVYRATSSPEDLILCELPPLLECVLSGTDGILLVSGPSGGEQASLLYSPSGIFYRALGQISAELQARQNRHRSSGSGGYTYQQRVQVYQLVGNHVVDLLTDRRETTRLVDTVAGVVIEGLHSHNVKGPEECLRILEQCQQRQSPEDQAKISTVVEVQITQADHLAGWALYGKLLLVMTPALDCLTEDRGLVQLRDGYDTFRGVYHLRSLAKMWQPRQPGDVNSTALTWVLREMLCGGSVAATLLLCLKQQQPSISSAMLEFMEYFSKVETNPVSCDQRLAGYTRALKAETLKSRSEGGEAGAKGRDHHERDEEARRIILELEKRLRAAEQGILSGGGYYDDAGGGGPGLSAGRGPNANNPFLHSPMMEGGGLGYGGPRKSPQMEDLREKFNQSLLAQEALHERLMVSEEEHVQSCENLLEAQLECNALKDEYREMEYKDNIMLMLLEQEVADTQTTSAAHSHFADELKAQLERSEQQLQGVEERLAQTAREVEHRAEAAARSIGESEGQASALQEQKKQCEALRLSLDAATEAKVAREIECGNLENKLEAMKVENQRSLLNASKLQQEESLEAHAQLALPQRELQELRRELSLVKEEAKLEAALDRQSRAEASEAQQEVLTLREDFHRALAEMAVPPATVNTETSEGGEDASKIYMLAARQQLEVLGKQWKDREHGLHEAITKVQNHVRELQTQLIWSSQVALDWAPSTDSEVEKGKLRKVLETAQVAAASSSDTFAQREKAARKQVEALRSELESERQKLSVRNAEHAQQLRRQDAAAKKHHAEAMEKQQQGTLPGMAGIQEQLRSEVEYLKGGAGGAGGEVNVSSSSEYRRLQDENEALKSKLGQLERQLPNDQRAQVQRLAFLEKLLVKVEGERSEFLVRATVAEEQVLQLQLHLKEMTESYQRQIVQLKLQTRATPGH